MKNRGNNKNKERGSYLKLPLQEDLEQFELEELFDLKYKVEKLIDSKVLSLKLDNDVDKRYHTLKLKDYIVCGRLDDLTLIINDNNTVEGYNKYYERLVIGKITNDNKLYLISYNLKMPFLECFDGDVNLETRYLKGYWFGEECTNSYMKKMSLLQNSESHLETLPDDNLNYKEIKNNLKIIEKKILDKNWYRAQEKNFILDIKEMK